MAESLKNRVALVTGASSGIGEAAALALGQAGVNVAISARRADRLEELAKRIEAAGAKVLILPGDVAEEETATRAVTETVKKFGRLDILVNSAGIIQAGGVVDANIAEWRRVMEVNFFSCLYTCKAAIGPLKEAGGGDIINISSTSGRRSAALFGAYAPSKWALNVMSEQLRQEVGDYGIRVCIIEPGATTTEVAENISDPKYRDFMRKHVSKEGAMAPLDIADAVIFVCALPRRANVSEIF